MKTWKISKQISRILQPILSVRSDTNSSDRKPSIELDDIRNQIEVMANKISDLEERLNTSMPPTNNVNKPQPVIQTIKYIKNKLIVLENQQKRFNEDFQQSIKGNNEPRVDAVSITEPSTNSSKDLLTNNLNGTSQNEISQLKTKPDNTSTTNSYNHIDQHIEIPQEQIMQLNQKQSRRRSVQSQIDSSPMNSIAKTNDVQTIMLFIESLPILDMSNEP